MHGCDILRAVVALVSRCRVLTCFITKEAKTLLKNWKFTAKAKDTKKSKKVSELTEFGMAW